MQMIATCLLLFSIIAGSQARLFRSSKRGEIKPQHLMGITAHKILERVLKFTNSLYSVFVETKNERNKLEISLKDLAEAGKISEWEQVRR